MKGLATAHVPVISGPRICCWR